MAVARSALPNVAVICYDWRRWQLHELSSQIRAVLGGAKVRAAPGLPWLAPWAGCLAGWPACLEGVTRGVALAAPHATRGSGGAGAHGRPPAPAAQPLLRTAAHPPTPSPGPLPQVASIAVVAPGPRACGVGIIEGWATHWDLLATKR
jgi:hypothetical protein